MLTEVIIFIWEINQMILCKEYHPSGTDIILAWNNTDASLQTPAMRYVINWKKLIKVFFSYFVWICILNITDYIFNRKIKFTNSYSSLILFSAIILFRNCLSFSHCTYVIIITTFTVICPYKIISFFTLNHYIHNKIIGLWF